MVYKMRCYRCKEDMTYIKDEDVEEMGYISMDCPNGCENGYLIPKNNPDLIRLD